MQFRFILSFILFLSCSAIFGQGIIVDDETYDAAGLAELLLANSCTEITTASFSSSNSVAYFDGNGTDFPLSEGVIIRTGTASYSEGIYTGENLSSQENDNSDSDLEAINNATGQPSNITDVAFLEYDFVPLSDSFNFDFIFASNEYGQWQCVSSDVFAFLLTNLDTGETENLGVIPNTTTPISVRTIRDQAHNSSCSSHNPQFFDTYTVDNPNNSSVNMRGYTVVMTASTGITPGDNYRIRMVIGESPDADFDSAVFIGAGSFQTTIDLGEDRSICSGDVVEIGTDLPTDEYAHLWKKDGEIIPGEEDNYFVVTEPGTYEVEITEIDANCVFTDEIVFDNLYVEEPIDLSACDTGGDTQFYDLEINDASALGLNPEDYEIRYFASEEDMQNNNPIPQEDVSNYEGMLNQTIYIKIYNPESDTFCLSEFSFDLLIGEEISLISPDPIEVCYSGSGYNINLSQINAQVINGGATSNYVFSYFESEGQAINNTLPIGSPGSYSLPAGFESKTLWVRVGDPLNSDCFQIMEFDIIEHPIPEVSELEDVIVCEEYILPEIEHGNYFTESMGEGDPLFAGDTITELDTYYIFNGPDENGCYNQSSFKVIVVKKYDVQGTYCGSFIVPEPPVGAFYTAPNGPYGDGDLIPEGTVITSEETIYYYAEVDDEVCQDEPNDIVIEPLPDLDPIENVIVCNSYQLPELEKGNYFTQPGGQGEMLSAGTIIEATTVLYVYYEGETCANEVSFQVSIIPVIEDIIACGVYIVPELDAGDFYTEEQGQGEIIEPGTEITISQTIYFYAENADITDCQNLYFDLTIIPLPPVDEIEDVSQCEEDPFILPNLENGEYFTESNREGEQLFAGDVIATSQIIYINNEDEQCMNETSFIVDISPLPLLPSFTDIYTCEPYVLPEPANGTFYTQPNGQGQELQPGHVLSEQQTLYIYAQSEEFPYCENEIEFTVYVNYVDLGEFEDIDACESYVLPYLNLGNYYTESGGEGEMLFAGNIITDSQTIYVYGQQGERFVCEGEREFEVTIYDYPELPQFEDIVRCESYTLPELDNEEADIRYYEAPNGQSEITPDQFEYNTPGEYRVYVHAKSYENPDCTQETFFDITINPTEELYIPNTAVCVDPETNETVEPTYIDTEIDEEAYTIEWYLNGELVHTGADLTIYEAGDYTILTMSNGENDGQNCRYAPINFTVWQVSQPIAKARVTTPDFSDIANIEVVIISGQGEYMFSLNGGPYQTDPIFRDVESGLHTISIITVYEICEPIVLNVQVLKYPKFFTPNQDGINDTWNITDLKAHNQAKIYIFTRYGQLLKTIKPEGEGWDGTFHGRNMPSNDYWFRVDYTMEDQQLQYRANFTLKR